MAADFWRKGFASFLLFGLATARAATLSAVVVPISKQRISISYVLISLALCVFVFLVVKSVSDAGKWKPGLISWWGQNALALYLAHLLVLGLFVGPSIDWWYSNASIALAAGQLLFALGVLSLVAWRLARTPVK